MNVKNRKCIRKLSLKSLYANRRRNLIALFLAALVSFTKILFFADLMLANEIHLRSSYYNLCVFHQSLDTDSSM